MKRNGGNYIRATIIKVKIPRDLVGSAIVVKMECLKQTKETEKLSGHEVELMKSFFFEIPLQEETPTNYQLDISAYNKAFLIFDSLIGKLSIPLSQSKLIDRKEWFTLKNSKEENSVMLLMSFADMREKKSWLRESSNSLCLEGGTASIEQNSMINNSVLNGSLDNKFKNNVSRQSQKHFITNYNTDMIINNYNCGNDTNNKCDNQGCVYPPSYRDHQSIIGLGKIKNPLKGDETGYLTTIDSFLDQNECLGGNIHNLHNNSHNFSATGSNFKNHHSNSHPIYFSEESEKMAKMRENLKMNRERLKSYEGKILKEKENLEQNIRAFKHKKEEFEKKNTLFNNNFNKLGSVLEKIALEKELIQQNKDMYINLNTMLFNSSNVDNANKNMNNINKIIATINSIAPIGGKRENSFNYNNTSSMMINSSVIINSEEKSMTKSKPHYNSATNCNYASIPNQSNTNLVNGFPSPHHNHSSSKSTAISLIKTNSNVSNLSETPNNHKISLSRGNISSNKRDISSGKKMVQISAINAINVKNNQTEKKQNLSVNKRTRTGSDEKKIKIGNSNNINNKSTTTKMKGLVINLNNNPQFASNNPSPLSPVVKVVAANSASNSNNNFKKQIPIKRELTGSFVNTATNNNMVLRTLNSQKSVAHLKKK